MTANDPGYGSVFLMMIIIAVVDSSPTRTARAMNRLRETTPVKNSTKRKPKANVSMNADNMIAFFLFIIRCLLFAHIYMFLSYIYHILLDDGYPHFNVINRSVTTSRGRVLDHLHDIKSFLHLSKHGVLSVKMGSAT